MSAGDQIGESATRATRGARPTSTSRSIRAAAPQRPVPDGAGRLLAVRRTSGSLTRSGTHPTVLDPEYLAQLDALALDDLRAMRSRCAEYELTVSYDRRMVQARMEILEAERDAAPAAAASTSSSPTCRASSARKPGARPSSATRVVGEQTPRSSCTGPTAAKR